MEDRMSNPASQMTLEALRSVPLFASLDDDAARDLRSLLSEKTVAQNTRLFRQGDTGDADVHRLAFHVQAVAGHARALGVHGRV